jgi:hypothetical protein
MVHNRRKKERRDLKVIVEGTAMSGSEARIEAPPQFVSAWRLARIELLEPLGRESDDGEIAYHLRQSATLRWLAGVDSETPLQDLVERAISCRP